MAIIKEIDDFKLSLGIIKLHDTTKCKKGLALKWSWFSHDPWFSQASNIDGVTTHLLALVPAGEQSTAKKRLIQLLLLFKMAVVWVMSCSLVEAYWCFRGACCLCRQIDNPDCMTQQPGRQPSSDLLEWEPKISSVATIY